MPKIAMQYFLRINLIHSLIIPVGETHGKAIFTNWLGLVYSLTSHDRLKQYMEGIDKQNPLGILQ